MVSRVAAILAVMAGWRECIPLTMVPMRRREVAWDRAVRVTQDSRQGPFWSPMMG
ncbi:MAG: hypothetical protein H6R33_893 [Actinobacteria bacterium]|nr:hypothetical protein [Actinomycetota bacterium]